MSKIAQYVEQFYSILFVTLALKMYQRPLLKELTKRMAEKRRFIQILTGPRQVGKTTLLRQLLKTISPPHHYASADEPTLKEGAWLEQQWEIGRIRAKEGGKKEGLLILDEIQKVAGWSETVKRLWDEDTRNEENLKVVLTGSAHLLIQKGLTESLTGRFETIYVPHWSFREIREAFDWPLEKFLFFGGYPGACELTEDEKRWSAYLRDAIIETTISRDILLLQRIDKPALLRRLFQLGCDYSGQILSYQKMVGQLQDAGNTTTLAHYLDLLAQCGMVGGLQKFSGRKIKQRGSSPKLQVYNTALMTALGDTSFQEAKLDREFWGRLVESAVGAHLLNETLGTRTGIFYWRHLNHEVDFVIREGKKTAALEVKSGRKKDALPGMHLFEKEFKPTRKLLVGREGIPLDEFLSHPLLHWVE